MQTGPIFFTAYAYVFVCRPEPCTRNNAADKNNVQNWPVGPRRPLTFREQNKIERKRSFLGLVSGVVNLRLESFTKDYAIQDHSYRISAQRGGNKISIEGGCMDSTYC